jgi:hypothetical protein
MPLNDNAERLIRGNIAAMKRGERVRAVVIGHLTEDQLRQINAFRSHRNFPDIVSEVLFMGKHMYESRVIQDGYTVDELIIQVKSAMCHQSRLIPSPKMTVIENPVRRIDWQGRQINDQAVLECSAKYPNPDLYSVIPKGDIPPSKSKAKQ